MLTLKDKIIIFTNILSQKEISYVDIDMAVKN